MSVCNAQNANNNSMWGWTKMQNCICELQCYTEDSSSEYNSRLWFGASDVEIVSWWQNCVCKVGTYCSHPHYFSIHYIWSSLHTIFSCIKPFLCYHNIKPFASSGYRHAASCSGAILACPSFHGNVSQHLIEVVLCRQTIYLISTRRKGSDQVTSSLLFRLSQDNWGCCNIVLDLCLRYLCEHEGKLKWFCKA